MEADEEWVYWSDEDTLNLNNHGGLYPKIQRSKYPYKYTKLFYCYYTQKARMYTSFQYFDHNANIDYNAHIRQTTKGL